MHFIKHRHFHVPGIALPVGCGFIYSLSSIRQMFAYHLTTVYGSLRLISRNTHHVTMTTIWVQPAMVAKGKTRKYWVSVSKPLLITLLVKSSVYRWLHTINLTHEI